MSHPSSSSSAFSTNATDGTISRLRSANKQRLVLDNVSVLSSVVHSFQSYVQGSER